MSCRAGLLQALSTRAAAALVAAAAACCAPGASLAQNAWYEGFESPTPSWRPLGGDAPCQVEAHARIEGQAHTGRWCEALTLSGSRGTYYYLGHDVGRPWVIKELTPSVQIKSDRGGLQLLALVVMPRSRDPRSGRPMTTVVAGTSYYDVGRWQQLRIDGFPQLLAAQTRALRAQFGTGVDSREAYVETLLLNVYGGPGTTRVMIDDLDLAGYAGPAATVRPPEAAQTADPYTGAPPGAAAPSGPGRLAGLERSSDAAAKPPGTAPAAAVGDAKRVRMDLSVLVVDGRPMFPRMIEYRGEPLALLAKMGFNAVWMSETPATGVLEEAKRLNLGVVATPARPVADASTASTFMAPFGPAYDSVLAWNLGHGLTGEDLEATGRWAEQVRAADRRGNRPLMVAPSSDLRAYSRHAELLLLGRDPLAGSLELTDYSQWLRERPRLARPGTPFWTAVQTEPAEQLTTQWAAFSPASPPLLSLSSAQIRLLTYAALGSGCRGILFRSRGRLDAADFDTRHRALTLELLNLELSLIEPWLAGGAYVSTVSSNQPEVNGVVMRTDRARLLLAMWLGPGAQCVPGQAAGNGVSFVVPGVPEEYAAYRLLPGSLQPIRQKRRETGGTRVTLEEFALTSSIVLGQDPLLINRVTQQARQVGPRAAELQRQLAQVEFEAHTRCMAGLAATTARPAAASAADPSAAVRQSLGLADGFLQSRDYASAYLQGERAMRAVRMVERQKWEEAIAVAGSAASSPMLGTFWTLPWQRTFSETLVRAPLGPNQLAGGEFEDLSVWLNAGWNHFQQLTDGITAEAELAASAARTGRMGLRLAARGADPQTVLEIAPVWIAAPPVHAAGSALVVVRGWVNVPAPIAASSDGLMIADSAGGDTLAYRVRQTSGWQPFAMYRLVSAAQELSLSVALTGPGEAWVDDLSMHVVPLTPRQAASPP